MLLINSMHFIEFSIVLTKVKKRCTILEEKVCICASVCKA